MDTKKHSETSQTDEGTFTCVRDVLMEFTGLMAREGYHMIAGPASQYAGFHVYYEDGLGIPGINPPKGYSIMRELRYGDPEISNFLATVQAVGGRMINQTDKDEGQRMKALYTIIRSLVDRPGDLRSPVAMASVTMGHEVDHPVSLAGNRGAFKVIPPRVWFPEAIQSMDAKDLLTLFPAAEKDQLMLILGRALAGPNGSKTIEGTLNHTARAYAVIVGTEAGMGKSTLMNYLKDAMGRLGYIVEELNSDFNKFGWGAVALSDLATIDDLTDDVQQRLLKSNQVKSIVSSGPIKVEDKGIDSYVVKSRTVMIGCSNMTNYAHYMGMDSGSLSRLNQLDTYCTHELQAIYGTDRDYRIKPYWEETAKAYGVSTTLLAAWLLRACLDRFLEVTGHWFDANGNLRKDPDKDVLEETIKENREQFRIDVNLSHAEELPRVAAHLTAIALADAKERDKQRLMDNLELATFGPGLLSVIVELFTGMPRMPEGYEGLELVECSLDCRPFLRAKLQDFKSLAGSRSVEDTFKLLVNEFKSTKGFGYPKSSAWYQARWMAEKRLIPVRVKHYEGLEVSPPDRVQEATQDITKLLLSLQS